MHAVAKTAKLSTQVKSASAFLELITYDDDLIENWTTWVVFAPASYARRAVNWLRRARWKAGHYADTHSNTQGTPWMRDCKSKVREPITPVSPTHLQRRLCWLGACAHPGSKGPNQ